MRGRFFLKIAVLNGVALGAICLSGCFSLLGSDHASLTADPNLLAKEAVSTNKNAQGTEQVTLAVSGMT